MDIESAALPPIRQATEDDLRGVLASDFGATVALVRNYGDRLEASAKTGGYRVAYYDAVTGQRHQVSDLLTRDQFEAAFLDYFQGSWNWHQGRVWQTM